MALLVHCQTEKAVVLVAMQQPDQIILFASDPLSEHLPGFHFNPKPRHSINEQILRLLEEKMNMQSLTEIIQIEQRFAEKLSDDRTLYLARLNIDGIPKDIKTQTFAEMMRRMPRTKARITYLKAIQAITGGFDQKTKAVESKDLDPMLN